MEYAITRADRAPLPASWSSEPRYLGYREVDRAKPYARFFRPDTLAVQPRVVEALVEGMSPAELGYGLAAVADRLPRPGYEPIETGWTRLDDGVLAVSVLTCMPRVTAAMWDWWFGWHSRESARYKLWHPCAHQFAALGEDRGADRSLTDRQRYVENVSYVDEYIGGRMEHLAIRFIDPDRMGFADRPGHTFVCARVSLAERPIAIGWLVHQVRRGHRRPNSPVSRCSPPCPRPTRTTNQVPHCNAPPGPRSGAADTLPAGWPAVPGADHRLRSRARTGCRAEIGCADGLADARHRHDPPLRRRDEPPRKLPAGAVRGVPRPAVERCSRAPVLSAAARSRPAPTRWGTRHGSYDGGS